MAIAFVGAGTTASEGSRNGADGLDIDMPAVSVDDFLLMFSHRNDNVGVFDVPSGWIDIPELHGVEGSGDDRSTFVSYRIAGASEPTSVLLTHTDLTGGEQWSGSIMAWSGVDTTTPLDVTPVKVTHYTAGANTSNPTPDPITTVTDGALAVVLLAHTGNATITTASSPPTGYTSRAALVSVSQRYLMAAEKDIPTAGTESPGVWDNTPVNTVVEHISATLALRPATAGGTTLSLVAGDLELTGETLTILSTTSVEPAVGALELTGVSPGILGTIASQSGSLELTGGTNEIKGTVSTATGNLELTGETPVVTSNTLISLVAGTLRLRGGTNVITGVITSVNRILREVTRLVTRTVKRLTK